MSDNGPTQPVDLGIYSRSATGGLTAATKVAIGISVAWLGLAVLFFTFVGIGTGPTGALVAVLAVVVPVALVWNAAIALGSAQAVRDETEQIQAALDAMRQVYLSQAQAASTAMAPTVERKIDEIAKGQKRAESALANFVSKRPAVSRDGEPPLPMGDHAPDQPSLGLATPEGEGFTVTKEDFIAAMHFPETPDDTAGFSALRRALADRRAARLITASQDVLTLLSQDGIYMDDLPPDLARPEVWRRFAAGERGGPIASIGGIRDRSSLTLTTSRMRKDSIFRDTCHHFLRTFDQVFCTAVEELSDAELMQAVDTRTARAFMLIGRTAGMFD